MAGAVTDTTLHHVVNSNKKEKIKMAIPKEARKLNRHFNSENRRNTGRNYRLRHTMVNPAGGGTVANLTGIEVCTIDPNKVGKSIPKKGKAPGELYTASPRHMRQLFIDLPQGAALTKIPIVLLFKTPEACYMDKLMYMKKYMVKITVCYGPGIIAVTKPGKISHGGKQKAVVLWICSSLCRVFAQNMSQVIANVRAVLSLAYLNSLERCLKL